MDAGCSVGLACTLAVVGSLWGGAVAGCSGIGQAGARPAAAKPAAVKAAAPSVVRVLG